MRGGAVLTILLLFLPVAILCQDHGSYYKDAFSWGQARQTFEVTLGGRALQGTFTASERGFRWIQIGSSDANTGPIPWDEIRSWSCRSGSRLSISIPNRFADI